MPDAKPASQACMGCGLTLPVCDGPTHPYIGASAACWAIFGVLMAKEYGDYGYPPVHRLTVDAYAAQHPGEPSPRSIQSVAVHLIGLCLALERGAPNEVVVRVIQRAAQRKGGYSWLAPPSFEGTGTVADIVDARSVEEHSARVEAWALKVWLAWKPHHATVNEWMAPLFRDG